MLMHITVVGRVDASAHVDSTKFCDILECASAALYARQRDVRTGLVLIELNDPVERDRAFAAAISEYQDAASKLAIIDQLNTLCKDETL